MHPRVVLISTYELGRQPFGLASPAAWLRRSGAEVTCLDLSRERLREDAIRAAHLVAFYLPMHTATRMAAQLAPTIRALNPEAHLCFYGLYAPLNAAYLRSIGAQTILGGEFEAGLVSLLDRLRRGEAVQREPLISLERQQFVAPDRDGLPALRSYARLKTPDGQSRVVGYTEASRGCKHLCRHCPIVPVYEGAFRIVQRDIVLEDIRRQVAMGAQHITFGDPDFFNGVRHALEIVRALHAEFPAVTYDATIKVEHLLRQADALPGLAETGCLFITSAVESVDDRVLRLLDKGHTRADFYEVVSLCREAGLILAPTFVPFTPWTTLASYSDLLASIAELDLIENVAPIQLAIRLLIPAGSKLLELEDIRRLVDGNFDDAALTYRWKHADRRVDELCADALKLVWKLERRNRSRRHIFHALCELAGVRAPIATPFHRTSVPYLNEPWYC